METLQSMIRELIAAELGNLVRTELRDLASFEPIGPKPQPMTGAKFASGGQKAISVPAVARTTRQHPTVARVVYEVATGRRGGKIAVPELTNNDRKVWSYIVKHAKRHGVSNQQIATGLDMRSKPVQCSVWSLRNQGLIVSVAAQ